MTHIKVEEIMLLADAYADAEKQDYLTGEGSADHARKVLATALEELIAESQREVQNVRDDAAFMINRKMKESQLRSASASWIDCEGVS
jgi:hypothetical protein